MSESRIIDLEIKISHQEYALEQLNQVVYEQQKSIDQLQQQLTKLAERFQEALGDDGPEIRGNEKPPHY